MGRHPPTGRVRKRVRWPSGSQFGIQEAADLVKYWVSLILYSIPTQWVAVPVGFRIE